MTTARRVEAKVKRLREKAFELMSAEKYEQAVDVYVNLAKLDPENGEWPRRAADCHWHLKNSDQRLKYSLQAAKAYSEAGLILKAIAMCKVVLSIDPNHKETQERLARFHSERPKAPERRRPQGVRHLGGGLPQGAKVSVPRTAPAAVQRNSLRPTSPEGEERKAERTRARMAAAAALRQARAQRRKEAAAAARTRRELGEEKQKTEAIRPRSRQEAPARPEPPPPEQKLASPQAAPKGDSAERVLARIALKPQILERQEPSIQPSSAETPAGPPSSAFPEPPEPRIPSLHLEPARLVTPSPGLDSLRLSERVPARNFDSLPPAKGHVYSLTLGDIPEGEFRAPRIPSIRAPGQQDEYLQVPVIPNPEELEPIPDSVDTRDISFGARLAKDRLELTKRDFADIPLLSQLAPDVLRQLITDVAMIELETNQVLFHEGDPADAMYVVVEGSVTAVTLPHGEKPIQLAHLLEGEFFGEIGLMSDQPRGATVSAHEPTRLLRFDREIVAVLVEQDPDFLATLLQFLKDRLVEDLMMSSPLFAPFSEQERYDLAEQFEFLEVDPNCVLLERGQLPIGMYVLLTGEATMKGASEEGTVRRLGSGDIFGEQALLANEMSRVEVRTTKKSFALCLPSDAFPEVIMTHPTVLEYLSTLSESSKGELDVAEDFLDHIHFF